MSADRPKPVADDEIDRLVQGAHPGPHHRLDVTGNGVTSRVDDPYRFAPSPRPAAEPGG